MTASGITPGQWQHLGSLQDSGSIWDHSTTVAASGITPGQWQHLGSLHDSGSIWDHSGPVAASGITPGMQQSGSLQDLAASGSPPKTVGSIWDHSRQWQHRVSLHDSGQHLGSLRQWQHLGSTPDSAASGITLGRGPSGITPEVAASGIHSRTVTASGITPRQ